VFGGKYVWGGGRYDPFHDADDGEVGEARRPCSMASAWRRRKSPTGGGLDSTATARTGRRRPARLDHGGHRGR